MNIPISFHRPAMLPVALFLALGALLPAIAADQTATFETDLGGWTAMEDTSRFDWARHTGGTPSYQTGPAGAHEGEYYVYLEASYGNTPGKIAYLEVSEKQKFRGIKVSIGKTKIPGNKGQP